MRISESLNCKFKVKDKFKLINTILEDLSSAGRWHSWKDPSNFPKKTK